MRLSIRWKLFLSIGVPLLLVYLLVLILQYRQLNRAAHQRVNATLTALAERNAAKLDGQLRSAAQIARGTASFLTLNTSLQHPFDEQSRRQLFQILRSNLEENADIYGSCVAFAPSILPANKRTAPYVYRNDDHLKEIDIAQDAYDYRQWDWYKAPLAAGRGVWTEPYFDKGAGNIVMCTYSMPFLAGAMYGGVATVDLQLDVFQHRILASESDDARFFVVSSKGTFISHANAEMILHNVSEIAQERRNDSFDTVLKEMAKGERGIALAPGLANPAPHWIAYAPVRSGNWSLAVTMPEADVTADIYPQLKTSVAAMLGGLVLILFIVLIGSIRITRPILRLAEGVRQLSAGNLNIRIHESRESDEIRALSKAFNRMVSDLSKHIEALRNETAAREAVESEIRVARKIQQSLLPSSFPPFPLRKEFSLHACNLAAKQVAGDFFDFFLADDDTLIFVIADVSGKGVPAALLMAVTRTILRNLATADASPANILLRASKLLSIDNTDSAMFVTAFMGRYQISTGKLAYANAGHPPPFRIRGDRVTAFGDVTGAIIGVDLGQEDALREKTDTLAVGDKLILYTDGVPEARSPSGEFFGDDRFIDFLTQHAHDTVDKICSGAAKVVQEFQDGNLKDDLTLLVIQRNT